MKTIFSLSAFVLVAPLTAFADSPQIVGDAPAAPIEASAPVEAAPVKFVISADAIYTAAGEMIEGGTVVISGTTIAAVTPGGESGEDGLHVAAITPGFVELSPRINLADYSVEESGEIMPTMRATSSMDLYDKRWERLLNSGTTTVLISPTAEDVVGGLTSVLKTGGDPTVEARVVLADATLAGSFGSHASRGNHAVFGRPTDHFSRRPTTRMGTEWSQRKAFYDTLAAIGNVDRQFAGWDIMESVLNGERPYIVQASATQDIRTAIYLKEEFGIPNMVVDAAAEAWREPGLLVRSGMAVILPPFDAQGRTAIDNGFLAWNSAKLLDDLEVPFALSSHGSASLNGRLSMQAGYAIRGGLSFEDALAAVTITPARLAGVDSRVGSIEVGKDADLVLWSGEPFAATSRIVGVVLNGELVTK